MTWKPTEVMREAALKVMGFYQSTRPKEHARRAEIIIEAVQPLIAAETLEKFGVKQKRMLGVVEYTGEMAAIIERAQSAARAKALKEAADFLSQNMFFWAEQQIRALIAKPPKGT